MKDNQMNGNNQKGNNNSFKTILYCCVAIAAIFVAYNIGKNNGAAQRDNLTTKNDSSKEVTKVVTPSQPEKVDELPVIINIDDAIKQYEENTRQLIREEYAKMLGKVSRQANDCSYFLFDIDRDDIPELWIKVGNCEADYMLLVYTYRDGIRKLYEDGAGHLNMYKGKDYILQVYAHMGSAYWNKLSYKNGKITSKIIFEEDIINTDRDYTEPKEKEVTMYPSDNKQPIYDL